MPAPSRTYRQTLRAAVITRVKNHSDAAYESFRRLVSLGCAEDFLCDVLGTIGSTHTPPLRGQFRALFGCDRKQFATVLKRMRQCARDIERLPVNVLRDISSYPNFEAANLPAQLLAVADRLKKVALQTRERGRPPYDRALAMLVNHVQERTRQPHHKEVADVVEAMRGDHYSVEAHKMWVTSHRNLLRPAR